MCHFKQGVKSKTPESYKIWHVRVLVVYHKQEKTINGKNGFYNKQTIQNSSNKKNLDFVNVWKFHRYYVEGKFINHSYFLKIITYVRLETLQNFLWKNWISSVHSRPCMKQGYLATYVVLNFGVEMAETAGFVQIKHSSWFFSKNSICYLVAARYVILHVVINGSQM